MHVPQIIYIVLVTIGVTIHLMKHGQPFDYKYNVFLFVLLKAFSIGLLCWGGFFG